MRLPGQGHLTYCSNIHPGESWLEVFASLRTHLPLVKKKVSPTQPLGIGLRLSNQASIELMEAGTSEFLEWMKSEEFYVFTMNGFPYGGFHRQKVKDQVHQPDWTSDERVAYTIRLFDLLAEMLPEGMDGGISTSPLSYKPWWTRAQTEDVFRRATKNLIKVVKHLYRYFQMHGTLLHLDIEPEPDGLIENSGETICYFNDWLLPMGIIELAAEFEVTKEEARGILLRHVTICYDVCHFAVAYESPARVMDRFKEAGIGIGKIQISSALKKDFTDSTQSRTDDAKVFESLDEPTYLHQVIARCHDNQKIQYPDLPLALKEIINPRVAEWRTHFHVPVFVESYGLLDSTQNDIREVLSLWTDNPMTNHLEVETYTWEVLPEELQIDINASIARELNWVKEQVAGHK
jgi:hypothetical protein